MLVDTKLPGWGAAIIDELKEITDKPVTMIVNTHTHFDHVGGNTEFPATVDIVAHENTASLMKEMRPVSGGPVQPNIFKDACRRSRRRRRPGGRSTSSWRDGTSPSATRKRATSRPSTCGRREPTSKRSGTRRNSR